ncbi:LOW QUALITY PROTEIN: hypothetical protein QTO34_004787 [Cnephaeus nilssonii]|uniref:Uncharacterized protein n=1 Tax=Cnephaeus nilssonii TaxID=3371016 RepID=A0AA40LKR7_CNENI|nr:LOW QUALITY PROTEIN: hypothetical protein QTO34_004787 [Eptesicus nilssonii]
MATTLVFSTAPAAQGIWAVWEGWVEWKQERKGGAYSQGKEGPFLHESSCIGLLVNKKKKKYVHGVEPGKEDQGRGFRLRAYAHECPLTWIHDFSGFTFDFSTFTEELLDQSKAWEAEPLHLWKMKEASEEQKAPTAHVASLTLLDSLSFHVTRLQGATERDPARHQKLIIHIRELLA